MNYEGHFEILKKYDHVEMGYNSKQFLFPNESVISAILMKFSA